MSINDNESYNEHLKDNEKDDQQLQALISQGHRQPPPPRGLEHSPEYMAEQKRLAEASVKALSTPLFEPSTNTRTEK
ncbi:MAG: hypothetical protein DRQ39_04010 [Gammaproteobacteria bacterium]|nr:MAG: hypothetical protein DRQ39_04010 [Gammaproteobacteria bacterium]